MDDLHGTRTLDRRGAHEPEASAPAAREAGDPAAPEATDPRRWREVAQDGRFEEAARLRVIAVGEGAETESEEDRVAIRALADAQGLLREKSWTRAQRIVSDVDARPDWTDWTTVENDLATLAAAGAALDRRDVDEALEALAAFEGREDGPFEAERLTQLGTARILDDDGEAARACFERALELDARHPRAMVNLGNVALEDGRIDDAIEQYQAALRIDDAFANAHHNLGVAYRRKGQVGKSVQALRRAQRAERSHDTRSAREEARSLGQRLKGRTGRWLLWGAAAVVVIWILLERGS